MSEIHVDTLVDPEPGPDIELGMMQEHELFRALVSEFAATLPERDRRIVIRYWLNEDRLSEIARDLNMSEDALWWVIRRVTPKLLDYFRRSGFGRPKEKSA